MAGNNYIISSWYWYGSFKDGDTILVQSGGALGDTTIDSSVASVTLEDNGGLMGSIWTGKEFTFLGSVYCAWLNLTLDILSRKPEDAIFIDDLSLLTLDDLSLCVKPSQEEGTYRLLGHAAGFSKSIPVIDFRKKEYGTLSLAAPQIDYGINRYTLHLNDDNELCLTVTTSIPEGAKILLYNDGQLVDDTLTRVYDRILPTDGYDQMFILADGLANGIQVSEGGQLTVMDGGFAEAIHVDKGTLEVLSGGTATDVAIDNSAVIRVDGGLIDGMRSDYGLEVSLYIGGSGIVRDLELSGFGIVSDYGDQNSSLTVDAGGRLENCLLAGSWSAVLRHEAVVRAGGTICGVTLVGARPDTVVCLVVFGEAYDTELTGENATLILKDGGQAYGTLLNYYNTVMSVTGAEANETEVNLGSLHVSAGGTVRNTRLDAHYTNYWGGDDWYYEQFGEIVVSEGGLILDTLITAGSQTVKQGGVASRTEIVNGGQVFVNGGLAAETMLTDGGVLEVEHGGVARDVHAVRDGAIKVGADGMASSVELDTCNMLMVGSRGRAEDVNVASRGYVYLQNGGVLGGRMQLAEGAVVHAFEGGGIDFDLSKANASMALLNDLSRIAGTPSFSITVPAGIAAGTYLLAEGAAGFAGTISVQDDGFYYGDLTLSDPLVFGWNTYTLNLNAGTLNLTVTRNEAEAPSDGIPLEGRMIYGLSVQNGETPVLSDGSVYYGVSVNSGGILTVESGTKLDTPLVNSSGSVTVADGGTVDNMFIASGTLNVLSGGKATNVVCDNASVCVEGGELDGIRRADLDPYYHGFKYLDVKSGGTVRNAELYSLRIVTLESDCLLDHSRLLGGGWTAGVLTVEAMEGSTVNAVSVEENTTIYLWGGMAYDTTVCGSYTLLTLFEGAQASGTLVDHDGAGMTLSGGVASDTEVRRGALTVSSGAVIRDTRLNGAYDSAWDEIAEDYVWKQMGEIVVSEGGLGLDTVITAGSMTVKGGASVSRTELSSTGRLIVNGGLADETTLKNGGQLIVRRGGVANGIHAMRDGGIEIESDAQASAVELDAYNTMMVSGGGRVEDATIASAGEIYLQGGAVLGGHMQLAEGAIVYAFDGGTIDFDISKANAATALLNDLSVITGSPDFTITVSADTAPGTYVLAGGAAGFAGTITVQDHAKIYGGLTVSDPLAYGLNTYALSLNAGTLSLTVTANATAAPAEGEDRPNSDKTVYAATVQPGDSATVLSGYRYIEATMYPEGVLSVESGGRMEESFVKSGGTLTLRNGATADDIDIFGGVLEVLSGGKATNVTALPRDGEYAGAQDTIRVIGGELDGLTRFANGLVIGELYIADHGIVHNAVLGIPNDVTVDRDGVLDDCTLAGGSVTVLAGGTVSKLVNGHVGMGGGTVYLYGVANDVLINNDGKINVFAGGVASGTTLDYYNGVLAARAIVSSGGSAVGTKVTRGELHVSSGGTIKDTFINGSHQTIWDNDVNSTVWGPVGVALVSEGGVSLDATVAGGGQTVKRGGVASRTLLTSSGHMTVLNGGLASETTLSGGGRLIVSRGGVAEDVHAVRDGAIEIRSDGVVRSVELGAVNMLTVSGGGLAEDVTVSSGGEVRLLKGGTLGGHIHLADGAVVSAANGGIVDFDLSKADDSTALLDNLAAVVGAPEFTITVSATTEPGTYRLADGAADFTGTITVRDDEKHYGDLSLTDSMTYGWNTYTLNLAGDALSLSIVKNDEFVAPQDDDLEIVVTSDSNTVSAGETLQWEKTGETVRVTSGGILQNTEIPWGGTLVLEENATLLDSIRLGADVVVEGRVNASNAFLELDISRRKEEYGTILSDLALLAASSYTVLVDPDQNKGEYILAGNSQNFYGSISVMGTDGTYRGSLSLSQTSVDYGVTRYTLVRRENNDLVFIVSSTFEDETSYILLYKERFLVLAKESVSNITVSRTGEYDEIHVIDKGVAEWITLGDGSVAEVEAGGYLLVSSQAWDSRLRFEYTAGDSTVIKGINRYGAYFFVENDRMENVCGENLTVRGNVSIHDYYGSGTLKMHNGVTLTGKAEDGAYQFYSSTVHDLVGNVRDVYFYGDSVVLNTEWNCSSVEINGNSFIDHAVFNSYRFNMFGGALSHATLNSSVYVYGGTMSDVEFNTELAVYGPVQVYGDLVFHVNPYYDFKNGSPYFDMHGHTAVFDYTGRTEDDDAPIMLDAFSEDVVFQLNLNRDQYLGKYKISADRSLECDPSIEGDIAEGARRGLVDTYNLCIDGTIVGTIDGDHHSFTSGDYVYTMTCEDETELFLTIDISDAVGDEYKVLWYNRDKSAEHAASASGLTIGGDSDCVEAVVRDGGILGGSELNDGGVLKVQPGGLVADLVQTENGALRFDYMEGDSTAITGSNQYGTFTVRNDMLGNVYGENITVTGGVDIHNYHGIGTLTTQALQTPGSETKNITISGTVSGGDYKLHDTDISDFVLESAGQFDYYSGSIDHARFQDATVNIRGGSISDAVFDTYVGLHAGTYSNIELNDFFKLYGRIDLDGDITVRAPSDFALNAIINVNGHTVNADFTNRTMDDGGLLQLRTFSENANFRLLFRDDQKTGTYILADNAGTLIDYFTVNVGGVDTEVLSAQHTEMDYNGYHYMLAHDVENQRITLTISATGVDAKDLSVSYTDAQDGTIYYAESLDGFVIDGQHYTDLLVKDMGVVSNTELAFDGNLTIEAGGKVITLDQKENSRLVFDYEENDTTVITGMNPYGAFFVEDNLLENVYGLYVTVTGNVLVNKYHNHGGELTIDGGTASGLFDGSGSLEISNGVVTGFTGSYQTYTLEKNLVEDSRFEGYITLGRGTYSEIDLNGQWFINGIFTMDGDLTLHSSGRQSFDSNRTVGYDMTFEYSDSGISGNGNTINLDLTDRSVADYAFLSLGRVYNTELQVMIDLRQPIGTYTLASDASLIGQKDFSGLYDYETNQWLFRGATVGDRDGVITIYDVNGIELANCTVNGDTEYYGRYNYKVFVDEIGELKLKVGWNNRDGLTYAADEKEENDSMETATVISGSGKDVVRNLTIHSGTDVDYFMFTLESPGRKSSYIGIEFKQWAGDLDISLYNDNGVLIDYARSVTDNERLSLSGFAAGTYYLKVSGYNGNMNEYKLVYDLPESIQMDDDYETGDDPSTPYFLERPQGQITINANISRPDDVDYYMFVLPERGLVSDVISLGYDDEFGNLDLFLYDRDGTTLLISSTNTVGGRERITMAGLQAGVYYAAVRAKDGSIGRYELVFDVNSHEANPDRFETNDTMKKATKLHTLNGKKTLDGLSIHSDTDVDYYRFSILEKGSADDTITLTCEPSLGDLDIEILNADGDLMAYSRTAEIDDVVSLKGLDVGEYYIRVYGYNNVANNYSLSWNVTNSALIPSDPYEGNEPILLRENQTVTGLSIAKPVEEDETREDTFKIVLEHDAWKRSKIILTDYRSDWEEGMAYTIKDAAGNVLMEGKDSEISLYGLEKGDYYLTLDTPNEDEYSEYTLITQNLPDSDNAKDNAWSIFIYVAADNNLENCLMKELLFMQSAILPEDVEVYVLMDRSEGFSVADRNWTDTRVGKLRHSKGSAVAIEWMYFDGLNTSTYADTHNSNLQKEWDTGSVATLEAFLDWGMREGRAENYALILTDHGSSLGFNNSDFKSDTLMNIGDIAELLRAEKYDDLSVVAFEQCLMGSDVVVSTMEGVVDYVVASEAVGWVPNWMIRYDVLLNSLTPEMTSRELSQKIVDSCDSSGYLDLTMASFKTSDHPLSDALNQFGALASQFTYSDWIALCKSFSKVHNYGDEICAYSDLGCLLNQIRSYHETISSTLMDATNALYDTVMNIVIDSTKITPDIYGTGLAVFNPVLSDPLMANFSYGGDSKLDYYATSIGKSAWGDFMYTLSRMADDCSDYIVDANGTLTFTDYTYYYEAGEIKNAYNLGAFSGNGVSFSGLYVDDSAYFNVTLMQPGEEGDAIVVTADNPNAKITVYLIQTLIPSDKQLMQGDEPYPALRRRGEDGFLSLDGVDYDKNRAFNEYQLVITSTEETTYRIDFVGDWTTGVDYFDYTRTKSISALAAGNNSIDKATVLPSGRYGGLVTCAGDEDYYKVLAVYADTLDVTVKGTGLTVREYNEAGDLLQTAVGVNGEYKLTVANENYVSVSGTADISANQCDPYTLTISEAAQTYLKAELNGMLPEKPVVTSQVTANLEVEIDISVEDGLDAYYSKDNMQTWNPCGGSLVADENGRYYFMAVDPATGIESRYVSLMVAGIDTEPPTVENIVADVTAPTNGDVVVTAEFSDDTEVVSAWYRIGETGQWTEYENGVTVTENATVYFKAVDAAGKTSSIASCDVTNIDKVPPTAPVAAADVVAATNGDVLVSATFSDDSTVREYSLDGGKTWTAYTAPVKFEENGSVTFRAEDAVGNQSETTYDVTNIDKVPPTAPVATADVVAATNGDVFVSATFSDDSTVREYSLDGGNNWTAYTAPVKFEENGSVTFRAMDAAGNPAETTYEVTNIDTIAPVITLTGDNQTSLQKSTLTATVDDGSEIYYSLDQKTWTKYEGAITVTANATYYFKATDAAGNEGTNSITFANIDTVAPVITLSGDTQTSLQQAKVIAMVDDGSEIYYSLDQKTWTKYEGAITVTANATYYFKSTDAAGNEGTNSISFENIDTVAPVITLSGDNQTPLQSATVTASVDDGSEIRYSLDQEVWLKYTGPITVTANATYFFRATDSAGNTGTAETAFTNIDTTAPVITLSGDNQSPLRSSTLTAVVNEESTVYYSTDEVVWTKYTGPITVTANATYYFTATDAAGNVGKNSISFTNIDMVAPVLTLAGDNQSPLRSSTLTAAVDDGSDIYYSTDEVNWTKYEGEIAVTANATYYFTATDAAGNVGKNSFTFANIDTVAPEAPVASADVTAPTNTDVFVSATFSDDSVKTEFSLDGVNWKVYTGPVRFAENGTVSFRGTDAAGNVSEVTSYEVTNIDKVALEKPIATADILVPTNTEVHVSAIFPEDAVSKEFSLDNQNWQPYTEAIVLTENGTVYFRNIDDVGNISEVTAYEVTNIDTVAPEAPVATADVVAVTNGNVFVTATFSEDSAVREYSLDGGENWSTYTGAVKFENNGSVTFRAKDAAGNPSETTYEVSNIDKVKPVITLTGDNQTALKSSTLTATVDDGSPIYYRIGDSGEWTEYKEPITVTDNATYNFLSTDAAGNEGTNFLAFNNIDTVAPVITLTGDNQTALKSSTLTATVDDGSPIYYRIGDSGEWTEYKEPITVTDNATYNFLSTDAAGNEGTNFLSFANIDREPPPILLIADTETPLQSSTITASTEEGLDLYYSTDQENWVKYEAPIDVTENGTYYFKATDAAGNEGTNFLSFANIRSDEPAPAKNKWTYMVYMAADSNIGTGALYDIIGMQQAEVDSEIDIYVLADRCPVDAGYPVEVVTVNGTYEWDSLWPETRVGRITCSPGLTVTVDWESWGELDTASVETLKRFVDWAQEQSPADNYGLILWDHGGENAALCWDITTDPNWNAYFTISEVSALLKEKGNIPIVIFNNCLLASEIVATQMAGSTEVIVASEPVSMSESTYNYNAFFNTITADMTPQEMAEIMVQNVVSPGMLTMLSSIDVTDSRLGDALEALADAVAEAGNDADKAVLTNAMLKAHQDGFCYSGSYVQQSDLGDMIRQAMADGSYDKTSEGFKKALADVKTVLEEVVLAFRSVPVNRGTGIAYCNTIATILQCYVTGRTPEKTESLLQSHITSSYKSNPLWGGLLYDLGTTYWNQNKDQLFRPASFDIIDVEGLVDGRTIAAMDLGCFSGKGEQNYGIALIGDAFCRIVITDEDKSTGTISVANEIGKEIKVSLLASDGSVVVAETNNGIAFENLAPDNYYIRLQSETNCDVTVTFDANWMTGVDRFDYAGSGQNLPGVNGNGSIDTATVLDAGYYTGLLTSKGDTDFYRIGNIHTEQYTVVINGAADWIVAEYDENGNLVRKGQYSELDNIITLTMDSMNYLLVEGTADLSKPEVNRYFLNVFKNENGSGDVVQLDNLTGSKDEVSWESSAFSEYIVECSPDNFGHMLEYATRGTAVDLLNLPAGTYRWRVKANVENAEWNDGNEIVSDNASAVPKVFRSKADASDDIFFATPNGEWSSLYYAQHAGSFDDWTGTNEIVSANGKGRIQDLFFGSADPSTLCLTDAENGDALFLDDVYTGLPEEIEENTGRLFRLQMISAGAGDDIVDMTSQRFEYSDGKLTIFGGDGDDIIWASRGKNSLYGDAGNDRIVGASGNDIIAGGIGNDRMHGGGGNDVFTFCDNWGVDNVEQLAGGTVTLWFASGSEANWNAETLTYSDGANSIKVSGVTADKITRIYGDDGSDQFATLSGMGAFFDATTERIFEESGKGILASL